MTAVQQLRGNPRLRSIRLPDDYAEEVKGLQVAVPAERTSYGAKEIGFKVVVPAEIHGAQTLHPRQPCLPLDTLPRPLSRVRERGDRQVGVRGSIMPP